MSDAKMIRLLLGILALLFALGPFTSLGAQEHSQKTNIVFTLVEDTGWNAPDSFYANHLKYMVLPKTNEKYWSRKTSAARYQNSPLWAAMNEDLGTAVGSIVDTVEKPGVRDNTYFIYFADNGYESKTETGKPVAQRTFHKSHPLLSHKYMISDQAK